MPEDKVEEVEVPDEEVAPDEAGVTEEEFEGDDDDDDDSADEDDDVDTID